MKRRTLRRSSSISGGNEKSIAIGNLLADPVASRSQGRNGGGARSLDRRRRLRYAAAMPHRPPRVILDASLRRLAYRCHPNGCPRDRTCCVGLVVEASRREVRAIDSLMDELARLVPRLRRGGAYASCFIDDPPGYTIDPGA